MSVDLAYCTYRWPTANHSPQGDANRQRTLNNAVSTTRSPIVSTSHHLRRPSANHSLRSSTSSLATSAVFSSNSSYSTPRSSLGHGFSLPELPERIAANDDSNHAHWCTYGEHTKPITTCEGWKRHEKEHESGYLCMPHGPVEPTQHGPKCALCSEPDPDADHLARHNISICVGKVSVSLRKSRRTDMIKHLLLHGVNRKVGAALTDQWRYSFKKKCFSCGFCVMIFFSITERSNHIDNEHWRHGQNMGAWELSKLIRGLLLEPEVQAAWRVVVGSCPDLVESNLRWEMPLADGLQLRLEMGEETGLVLAKAALELSNYEQIRQDQESVIATTDRKVKTFGPVSEASRNSNASTAIPLPGSFYQPLTDYTEPRGPFSRLLPGSLSLNNVENSGTGFQASQCDSSLNPSSFLNDPFLADDFGVDSFSHLGPIMNPNVGEIPSQLSTYACPMEWLSMDTSEPYDDKTRIQSHLSESGGLLIAQMSSPRHGQPVTCAVIEEEGPILDPRTGINTSSTSRLPTSTFYHGGTAQLYKKPLPPLPLSDPPRNASRAAGHSLITPMDLSGG